MAKKKLYIETYGCQMNVADSEVVAAVMAERNYELTDEYKGADAIFVNTCSVRDNAEKRVWNRLREFNAMKKHKRNLVVGLIGCMAERIGEQMVEEDVIDLAAGPDAYRDLPYLMDKVRDGGEAVNVELTLDETYDNIIPQRLKEGISGYVSITRGCNNFCTYCIVPYTRGRERSRDPKDILAEVEDLLKKGYKEVTLLGQNVNSFKWLPEGERKPVRFPNLIEMVAKVDPTLRVRFSTPHPKDISEKLIRTMVKYPNICRSIHLPVQSGSSKVLKTMNRKYDREWYMKKINMIKDILPSVRFSTDVFVGFSGETEEEFQETLSLMREVRYDIAFMYKYSERPGTYAHKHLEDDIPEEVKSSRLTRLIHQQNGISLENNQSQIGDTFEVLIEGVSKKSEDQFYGRTSQNVTAVFPKGDFTVGEYAKVKALDCTQSTFICEVIERLDAPSC